MRKGWVDLPHGQVHYRRAGSGPPIVLLHDSPRSSVLHEPVLEALADEFTAIALDTPGYGRSTPLPLEQPEIPDFGRALAATLAALGIERCPVYAFHTSSKIALELLIQDPARTSVVVMDGLSIPSGPPDLEFIRRYMEPFLPSEDGSHVASGWSRARDFHRFFPWFAHTRLARLPLGLPDAEHLHRYATDLFMAGPHYADAYSAAMRYDPLPAIGRIAGRAVFMCREDDVLYPHLDRLPSTLPTGATIERLGPSRHAWITRLRELFREHVASTRFDPPDPLAAPADDSERQGYVPVPAGQIRVRRMGRAGPRPAMLLHDVPGSGAQLRELMHGLAIDRTIYVPDLSGLGESSALPDPDLQAYAATLVALIDGLGLDHIDVYAEFLAGPIALAFATVANGRVGRLVLDGLPMPGTAERRTLWRNYCPKLVPKDDGTHLVALWHRLRDQELAWPWYAREREAIRYVEPRVDDERLHERLVDVMRQLDTYGAAALAAIDCDVRSLLARVDRPALLTQRAGDPRYAWAEKAARQMRSATLVAWPNSTSARVQLLREFFDG